MTIPTAAKHTPCRLRYGRMNGYRGFVILNDETGGLIAESDYENHCERIVRAVNCHDELVAALKSACDALLANDGFAADPTNYGGWADKDSYEAYMQGQDALTKVKA